MTDEYLGEVTDHKAIAIEGFNSLDKINAAINEHYSNEDDPYQCKKDTSSCCMLASNGEYLATGFAVRIQDLGPCECSAKNDYADCVSVSPELTALLSSIDTQSFDRLHYLLMENIPREDNIILLLCTPIMVIVLKGSGIGTQDMRTLWEKAGRTWINLELE